MDLKIIQMINSILFVVIFFINHKEQAWKRIPFVVLVTCGVLVLYFAINKPITPYNEFLSLWLAFIVDFVTVLIQRRA